MNFAVNFAATASASAAEMPQLRMTCFSTGVCSRAINGCTSELDPVTPKIAPVRRESYQPASSQPASRSRSRATTKLSSCRMSVTSNVVGGRPNSSGLNATSGTKPPRRQ